MSSLSLRRSLPRVILSVTVAALCALVFITVVRGTPHPLDDHFLYQRFVNALAGGSLDLSIGGFHGSDFFAVPVAWLTHSPISQILALIVWAALLPLLAFFAGKTVFGSEKDGLILSAIIAMMPFTWIVLLRGWTGPAYWGLMFLSLACAKKPWLAGVFLGFAILTKPFAIALLPLLLVLAPKGKTSQRWMPALVAGALVFLYILIQLLQVGHIAVGAHADLSLANTFADPDRIVLNLAHALQILFSVHNYYFLNPSLTGPGNLLHTTPVLVFLGLWALLDRHAWFEKRQRAAILLGLAIGIGLNALLDHIDHYYLEAAVLLFILAAMPVIRERFLWLLLVFITLHFQWLYAFLEFRELFRLDLHFFLVPAAVDLGLLVYSISRLKGVRAILPSYGR